MSDQIPLSFPNEIITYEIPEFIHCDYHGDWNPRGWYDDKEIIKMIDEQGFIDCAICLAEIVGITG